MSDQRSLADFLGGSQDTQEPDPGDKTTYPSDHPIGRREAIRECSCATCRDDTITLCPDESTRLLQVSY